MKKYVMTSNNGKYYVWITTTGPKTGVVSTPWGDEGTIICLSYTSARNADRAASLLLKGLDS